MQILVVALAGLLAMAAVSGQSPSDPPGLVKFLTYQSGRPKGPGLGIVSDGCGVDEQGLEDRAAVKSLVSLGAKAIPAIEEAIGSLEKGGPQSGLGYNLAWLLYAYAKIKGPGAVDRLRSLANDPKFAPRQLVLDESVALALGLTSYVSSSRLPLLVLGCRSPQPRDALDQMILAWERADRASLEDSLGPRAGVALESLLAGRPFASMWFGYWFRGPYGAHAVGYRFLISNGWSEPELGFEGEEPVPEDTPEIETRFADKSGVDCGAQRVRFARGGRAGYLVDDGDLGGLLGLVASCAAQ